MKKIISSFLIVVLATNFITTAMASAPSDDITAAEAIHIYEDFLQEVPGSGSIWYDEYRGSFYVDFEQDGIPELVLMYKDSRTYSDTCAVIYYLKKNGSNYVPARIETGYPDGFDGYSSDFLETYYGPGSGNNTMLIRFSDGIYGVMAVPYGYDVERVYYRAECDHGKLVSETEKEWETVYEFYAPAPLPDTYEFFTKPEEKPAIPATGTAYTLKQTAELDGKEVAFDTYALKDANGNGTNYMKIRDLAYVLNGSAAQFALGYDAGSISFKSKTPYTPNGTEMTVPFTGDQPYSVTPGTFLVDSVKKELTTISILDAGNGYTYIKVRDLAEALNFYVGWNGKIVIDTGRPYEG